jgi:hypothetical protein
MVFNEAIAHQVAHGFGSVGITVAGYEGIEAFEQAGGHRNAKTHQVIVGFGMGVMMGVRHGQGVTCETANLRNSELANWRINKSANRLFVYSSICLRDVERVKYTG